MTVKELIGFLQMVKDQDKDIVFDDKFIPNSYASITTIKDTKLFVVLGQLAWNDNKDHFIEGE